MKPVGRPIAKSAHAQQIDAEIEGAAAFTDQLYRRKHGLMMATDVSKAIWSTIFLLEMDLRTHERKLRIVSPERIRRAVENRAENRK